MNDVESLSLTQSKVVDRQMKPYDLHVKLDLDLDQLVNMIKLIIEFF